MIAALYVEANGIYSGRPDVEVWDIIRDARKYDGPYAVVAHPPCERWGRYWSGGPSAKVRRKLGDDDGCFSAALQSVRRFGGVLEHPEASHAFKRFGLTLPPRSGGWVMSNDGLVLGWTCCVEQGHYGHRARKATWLYAVGCKLPSLKWGSSGPHARLDLGFHSAEERRFRSHKPLSDEEKKRRSEWRTAYEKASGMKLFDRLSDKEARSTPPAFAELLLSMARSVHR